MTDHSSSAKPSVGKVRPKRGLDLFLDWVVKLTSAMITVPVTWVVAQTLFGDIGSDFVRRVMQVAAVVLVDGLLLRDWILLDVDVGAPPERKAQYAVSVSLIYVGILILALQHGEGFAGLVFRVAMGIGLLGSVANSFGSTIRAAIDKAAQYGARADWRVRWHARRLERKEAKIKRESESQVFRAQVLANQRVEMERIRLETQRKLAELHKEESVSGEPYVSLTTGLSLDQQPDHNGRKGTKRRDTLGEMVALLRVDPTASKRQIAKQLGVSIPTVSRWYDQAVQIVSSAEGVGNSSGEERVWF